MALTSEGKANVVYLEHGLWLAVAGVFVWIDFATRGFIDIPILYLIPVAWAAWRRWLVPAYALAVIGPTLHLLESQSSYHGLARLTNTAVRIVVFAGATWLIARVRDRQQLLQEVRVLRGLLPVCSFCKKIRNDVGVWEAIESYVSRHSEAEFTHGLCPPCAKQHYDLDVDAR